jgi:DNA polymerase
MATTTAPGAEQFIPPASSIEELRQAAQACRGCRLYQHATQTVFGSGPQTASVVMVGEQPGDVEDRLGQPFVGPAGKVLDRAVADAGLAWEDIYLTNAVKHFKFKLSERGKRRIHQPPNRGEIVACLPWLLAELALVQPSVVVALGATAAKALLGPSFRVTRSRGVLLPWPPDVHPAIDRGCAKCQVLATIHPSAVLRADDREGTYAGLVEDLKVVAEAVG